MHPLHIFPRLVPVARFPALSTGRKFLLYVATGSCVPAFAVAITLVFALKGSGEKGGGGGLQKFMVSKPLWCKIGYGL